MVALSKYKKSVGVADSLGEDNRIPPTNIPHDTIDKSIKITTTNPGLPFNEQVVLRIFQLHITKHKLQLASLNVRTWYLQLHDWKTEQCCTINGNIKYQNVGCEWTALSKGKCLPISDQSKNSRCLYYCVRQVVTRNIKKASNFVCAAYKICIFTIFICILQKQYQIESCCSNWTIQSVVIDNR